MNIKPADSPYFTVFTPTYNRAHTLGRVYDSLLAQTYRNFEWIIVDDGSSDNTSELVSDWVKDGIVNIIYIKQRNQGKHVAHNCAVENANGKLFLVFDSDDMCVPETLETFKKYWESIPEKTRANFSTLSVLCQDQYGQIIGPEYPRVVIDCKSFSEQLELRTGGERWGVNTVESMRLNQFPVYPGEKFVPEGLIWNRLSCKYSARFVNIPLRIYEQQGDSLSRKSVEIRARSPLGTLQYYSESIGLPLSFKQRVKNAGNLVRFSFHAKRLSELKSHICKKPILIVGMPLGLALYLKDKIK